MHMYVSSPGVPHLGKFSAARLLLHVATCTPMLRKFNNFLSLVAKTIVTRNGRPNANRNPHSLANPNELSSESEFGLTLANLTPKSAILSGEFSELSKRSKFSGLMSLQWVRGLRLAYWC